jgi:hypothetical protein
MISDKK